MKFSFALVAWMTTAFFFGQRTEADIIYGLTNLQQLVRFDSNSPGTVTTVSLPGFGIGGQFLESIDVRPGTGVLYGLSNQNNLFTIDPNTGISNLVGGFAAGNAGRLTSLDFNPVVDLIRVVESSGTPNNLRVSPVNGSLVSTDGNLAFAAGDANFGDTPDIVAISYTNSLPGATSTTLYGIDANNNILVTQNPANSGTLQTVGALGLNVGDGIGFNAFDISGQSGLAFFVGNSFGAGGPVSNTLYQLDLATGQATAMGTIGISGGTLRGLTVQIPEPSGLSILSILGIGAAMIRKRKVFKAR